VTRISVLALITILGSNGLEAQLTTPLVGPVESHLSAGSDEIQALFPSEFVANRIRAALADPRNQAHLTAVEDVLGARGSDPGGMDVPPDMVGDPAQETSAAASALPRVGTVETRLPETERGEAERNAVRERSGGPAGIASWLETRLSRSRVLALEAAHLVRARLGTLAGSAPASWIPWAILILALGALVLASALVRGRTHDDRSLKAARRLTRRGLGPAEVARRTGLSRDVIRVIGARRKPKEVA